MSQIPINDIQHKRSTMLTLVHTCIAQLKSFQPTRAVRTTACQKDLNGYVSMLAADDQTIEEFFIRKRANVFGHYPSLISNEEIVKQMRSDKAFKARPIAVPKDTTKIRMQITVKPSIFDHVGLEDYRQDPDD